MARRADCWSEDQARAHLAAFRRSGLALTTYCERIGVSTQRMYYWRERLEPQPAPAFVEVDMPGMDEHDGPVPDMIELSFPSGHVLRVPAALGLDAVLRAAGLLPC